MADIGQKTVSHKHLLTINFNKLTYFESKMVQIKHKPLRTIILLCYLRENEVYIWNVLILRINTGNGILLCKSNTQIIKFLKEINTI